MSEMNYSLQTPHRFLDKLALKKRLEMFDLFCAEFPPAEIEHVLDVGVTADSDNLSSNYFETYFSPKEKIIALSNQEAGFLEKIYPGLTFKLGDAKQLPFADQSIDVVISSSVIEHIGHLDHQRKMIAECFRVARKGVFITTPNRWHPIEVHTLLPLFHWLPKRLHRSLLRKMGLTFYSQEENLNLLDKSTMGYLCNALGIKNYTVKSIKTYGFVSNLILIIKKGT